jgi:phosphoserine phosphatase
LEVSEDGTVLTGKVLGDIVDGQRKRELFEMIAEQEEISFDQVHFLVDLIA